MQNQLDGIALGATQIDVQLKKGKPARELAKEEESKDVRWIFFDDPQREDQFTLVLFRKDDPSDVLRASIVCRHASYVSLLGFSNYADETAIIKRLGKPTHTSIRADGLAKTISFEQWKAAFEFEKGAMTTICISESGKVRYAEEHGGKPSEDGGESK